jgi:pimeloyl-ACP methyl ester carboxylesterase
VAVVATVVALSRGDDSDGDDRSAAADTTGTTDTTLVSSSGPSTVATSSAVATTDVPTSIAAAEEPIPAPVGYVPTITDRDCGGDTFAEGKARTTCFTLTVPQNRANPVRTISLSGYRIASTSNDPDLPTLIDLGPEGGFENPVLDVANVVILPARGYGLTDPSISCTEMKQVGVDGLVLPSGDPGIADRMLDAVQACRDRLSASGIDVASYNYEAQVGDLIDYMWASKLPSAFITGATDDAPALLVAADRFPDAFDGIILDNPRDPGSGWREDPVDDLSAALDRYVALCNADAACASRYPTLLDDLTTQFDRLEADPVLVSGTGDGYAARNMKSLRSDPYEVLLDGPRAIRLLQYVLRVRYNYNELAQSINDPNSTAARAAVSALIGLELGDATGVKNSAELSFRCSSLPGADSSAAASAAVKPVLAGVFDPLLDAECAIWKVPQVSQEFISASTGPTPTLIGVGELAPAPAREWAAALDRSRPNVTVAIFPTVGNFVELTGPPCYQDLLRAFIVDPTSSLDVATCEADSPPIEFLT